VPSGVTNQTYTSAGHLNRKRQPDLTPAWREDARQEDFSSIARQILKHVSNSQSRMRRMVLTFQNIGQGFLSKMGNLKRKTMEDLVTEAREVGA